MNKAAATEVPTVIPPNRLIERFADDCELRGMSHSTVERYVSSIKDFRGYIESRGYSFLAAANREVLRDFLDYL